MISKELKKIKSFGSHMESSSVDLPGLRAGEQRRKVSAGQKAVWEIHFRCR